MAGTEKYWREKKHRDSRMKLKLEEYSLTEWDHLGGRWKSCLFDTLQLQYVYAVVCSVCVFQFTGASGVFNASRTNECGPGLGFWRGSKETDHWATQSDLATFSGVRFTFIKLYFNPVIKKKTGKWCINRLGVCVCVCYNQEAAIASWLWNPCRRA